MNQRDSQRCTACGAALDTERREARGTIVRERNKEFVLRHCPRCATLLIRVRPTPVPAG